MGEGEGKVGGSEHLQPGNLLAVRKAKDELVHDAIYPNRPTDKLERCVVGVIPNEMVPVEVGQPLAPYPTCHLFQVSLTFTLALTLTHHSSSPLYSKRKILEG